ncbi:MAG TPA: PhoX family phosphatase [Waterburya sp.]
MSKFNRRQLLIFFGASAGAAVLVPALGEKRFGSDLSVAEATEPLKFTPVRLPHPLPIYQQQKSYLPTTMGQGSVLNPSTDTQLSQYNVIDDVVVPPEYERYVIARWGDRIFPNQEEYFGYNCDYTGFVPINGNNPNDGYLWVNHEYISFPFSVAAPEAPTDLAGFPETYPLVIGGNLPADKTSLLLLGEFYYNQGGSVVRISRSERGEKFAVVRDSKNRRLHGLSGLGINSQRSDQYKNVTTWGTKSYQKGDQNYLIGTGPAATQVFNKSVDGLGHKIIGTAFNCSGGTTPWGRILSAEENFQGSATFFMGVTESVKPDGTQTNYTAGTSGEKFGLVGEKYGWMVEIDPAEPNYRPRKHTALGRFRHENIAIRAEAGKKLIAYMGDDRRGGHTWKFVSRGTVSSPTDKNNSALFEEGTLYVARYNPDGTGRWIPLELDTPTDPIAPSVLASVEIAALGKATKNGLLPLPKRQGIAAQTSDGGLFGVDTTNEATALPAYRGKRLSNFYTSQGAVLCDAFLAANLVGGTPTARPEDIEIHPRTKHVYISYTDAAPGGDGYPDSRIFVVSKYTSAVNDTQHLGGLYKIIEDSSDCTGTSFRWQRFAQGGEAGAKDGTGFTQNDNLVFDSQGNVWIVTDMSTGTHNGFDVGAAAKQILVDHKQTGTVTNLNAVFGNNWLLFIPTSGPNAGEAVPFAYGPPRCEMTGPTFVGDTLILSVQHPGEDCPFSPQQTLSRSLEILNLDGTLFNQTRTVPRGSNWPSNIEGNLQGPPKPSVIGICRKQPSGRFV